MRTLCFTRVPGEWNWQHSWNIRFKGERDTERERERVFSTGRNSFKFDRWSISFGASCCFRRLLFFFFHLFIKIYICVLRTHEICENIPARQRGYMMRSIHLKWKGKNVNAVYKYTFFFFSFLIGDQRFHFLLMSIGSTLS